MRTLGPNGARVNGVDVIDISTAGGSGKGSHVRWERSVWRSDPLQSLVETAAVGCKGEVPRTLATAVAKTDGTHSLRGTIGDKTHAQPGML